MDNIGIKKGSTFFHTSFQFLKQSDVYKRQVYGEIKSAWTKKGGDFSWDITLPGNTSAIVRIPKKYNVTVGNLPGVRRVSATEGYMEVEIGSGSYHFGK